MDLSKSGYTKHSLMQNAKNKYRFIVMDFEFVRWHNQKTVLISGAISGFRREAYIQKLRGHPLVLFRDAYITKFDLKYKNALIKFVTKSLRNKPGLLQVILNELREGINTPDNCTTLDRQYIVNYLNKNEQTPILVLWNGSEDSDILYRLNVSVPIILNMTAYEDYGDSRFFLKLINYANDELIFVRSIGSVRKNGRMLSLEETHHIICNVNHDLRSQVHDPVVDVLYTKCIFEYILRTDGYNNILTRTVEQN